MLVECKACGSEYLDAMGSRSRGSKHCPFCRLVRRVEVDPRVRESFPHPPLLMDLEAAAQALRTLDPQPDRESPPN
jgi:hypothetical protein